MIGNVYSKVARDHIRVELVCKLMGSTEEKEGYDDFVTFCIISIKYTF